MQVLKGGFICKKNPHAHLRKVKVADEVGPRCHGEDQDGADTDVVGVAGCGHEHEGGKP